jgi:hypothetical protein
MHYYRSLAKKRPKSANQLPKRGLYLHLLIWLGQKSASGGYVSFKLGRLSRCDNQSDRRPPISDHPRQPQPIHGTRHLNIRKNRSNVISALQELEGLVGIRCRDCFKTRLLDHLHCVHADKAFIFHYQHHRPGKTCSAHFIALSKRFRTKQRVAHCRVPANCMIALHN